MEAEGKTRGIKTGENMNGMTEGVASDNSCSETGSGKHGTKDSKRDADRYRQDSDDVEGVQRPKEGLPVREEE